MLTSKFQLDYVLTRGGGGKLSRAVYPQILLQHLLQEYLVKI